MEVAMHLKDAILERHGSIHILRPLSTKAWEWAQKHLDYESWQVVRDGISVDPRFSQEIMERMEAEGMII